MMIPSLALLIVGSVPDLIVILLLALLFFGGKKIGDIGKGLGEGIKNFKTSIKGDEQKPEDKKPEEKKPA
jgi:sec-independent protein translocase protein TatA